MLHRRRVRSAADALERASVMRERPKAALPHTSAALSGDAQRPSSERATFLGDAARRAITSVASRISGAVPGRVDPPCTPRLSDHTVARGDRRFHARSRHIRAVRRHVSPAGRSHRQSRYAIASHGFAAWQRSCSGLASSTGARLARTVSLFALSTQLDRSVAHRHLVPGRPGATSRSC